jgi:hypothetical protein
MNSMQGTLYERLVPLLDATAVYIAHPRNLREAEQEGNTGLQANCVLYRIKHNEFTLIVYDVEIDLTDSRGDSYGKYRNLVVFKDRDMHLRVSRYLGGAGIVAGDVVRDKPQEGWYIHDSREEETLIELLQQIERS